MSSAAEKHSRERRCIDFIAAALRGTGRMNPDKSGWPDGWVRVAGKDVAVEVVEAFERTPDENPKSGSIYVREYRKAEMAAQVLHDEKGIYPLFGVQKGKAFAIDPAVELLPISLQPVDVSIWIAAAVRQKIDKRYDGAAETILGVNLHHPFLLDRGDLRRAASAIGEHPFREIWIVNGYGDPAQRLPA